MGKIYRRNGVWYGTADDMTARIEELEAKGLANRVAIMRLEAKLAKAVEALDTALSEMVDYADTHPAWSEIWEAREAALTTLAELKKEKDDG
jgi:chromosome segregation ATPase